MRILYFALLAFLSSCSKSVGDECFVDKMNTEDIVIHDEQLLPYSVKQILAEKPNYLEIINLTQYRDFKKDSLASYEGVNSKESEDIFKKQDKEFKEFKEAFSNQFLLYAKQQVQNTLYALGKNRLGYWLLRIENDKPTAHFLGLSFSHYYINIIQEKPIIKDGFLQFEGSLVKIIKVAGFPGYDDYSAMEDGKLFKINLKNLTQDSDKDGYNDIFEKSFGLNPNSKDTDGDRINDFEDLNPMFKSKKDKFTELYQMLLPNYGTADLKKMNYVFQVYKSDCEYFHQVNPELRVLFVPESTTKQTYYERMTDVIDEDISKIKKDKKDPNRFYIQKSGNSFGNDYSADYENGKWVLKMVGGYNV
nr:hypothetical protein [uncultured Chryseobacterium sp.]